MPRTSREVVFVVGVRTPFGKAGEKGMYAQTRADDLVINCIRELMRRLASGVVTEVIIATDPNTEGEATATYLVRMLRDIPGLTVTRIASGLPMGGDLEFADELTLGRALAGRRAMV